MFCSVPVNSTKFLGDVSIQCKVFVVSQYSSKQYIFLQCTSTPIDLISMESHTFEPLSCTTCFWICCVENKLSLASYTFIFTQKGRMRVRIFFFLIKILCEWRLLLSREDTLSMQEWMLNLLNTVISCKPVQSLLYSFWKSDARMIAFHIEW